MTVTQAQIDAFKQAWEDKDAELSQDDSGNDLSEYQGKSGDRTRAGLEAVAALRTHHKYGGVVDTGFVYGDAPGDEDRNHAITDLKEAILVQTISTVAIKGDGHPLCLLGIQGKLNHSPDTFEGYFIFGWEFVGFLIGELTKAGLSAGPEDTRLIEMGIDRSIEGDKANGKEEV